MFDAQLRFHSRLAALLLVAAWSALAGVAQGQFTRFGAVGGVKVDVDGVISHPDAGDFRQLQVAWQQGLEPVPADLNAAADLRFVSLRSLEAEAARALASGKPLPDAVRYLAGLQRVRYVLVYPEQKDIVLAGPAEGWRVNSLGSVVGKASGRPVLLLDDLLVALRVAESANASGISCSIDPTPEGLARMQQLSQEMARNQNMAPQVAGRQMEQAVGNQKITVTGVPATSHFARVIVAADFRMKRLAMDFEPSPVDGMPSFLDLISSRRAASNNMMPRWWLAPNYDPIRRDDGGLAWELRGQGVKCMHEEQFLAAGSVQRTGKTDPTAQKWADTFTAKFEELAHEDSAFGELRNVMDLAVVAALVAKERLLERSGLEIPRLQRDVPVEEYIAPRAVPSQASFVRAGRTSFISVSGGVQIFPWQVADLTEVSKDLATARPAHSGDASTAWYWQKR
ncbi:MAG: DUF1598 domain-containing protein [Pirellulales bacterium]